VDMDIYIYIFQLDNNIFVSSNISFNNMHNAQLNDNFIMSFKKFTILKVTSNIISPWWSISKLCEVDNFVVHQPFNFVIIQIYEK